MRDSEVGSGCKKLFRYRYTALVRGEAGQDMLRVRVREREHV